MEESIKPFITRRVLVLPESTPSNVVARALHERRVGSAIVCDKHHHITGIITDRDLSTQVLGFDLPAAMPVSEVMTPDILTVSPDADLSSVVTLMEIHGIRRIPVVERSPNGKEKCVGMITLDDLLAARSLTSETVSKIVKAQISKNLHPVRTSERSQNHKEQTLDRFNKVMGENLETSKDEAERISFYLLKQIVKRVTYSEAVHFISQLPELIHEDLLSLPAGPNTRITEGSIESDLVKGFQLSRDEAKNVAKMFWLALGKLVTNGALQNVSAQFSRTMREFFGIKPDTELIELGLYAFDGTSEIQDWP